jgi:hypothetical protein
VKPRCIASCHRRLGDASRYLDQHNAPTIMIAEKGAAMIKAAARRRLAA